MLKTICKFIRRDVKSEEIRHVVSSRAHLQLHIIVATYHPCKSGKPQHDIKRKIAPRNSRGETQSNNQHDTYQQQQPSTYSTYRPHDLPRWRTSCTPDGASFVALGTIVRSFMDGVF